MMTDSGLVFFFQAEDGIRDIGVTGVQTCALPIFDRESAYEVLSRKEELLDTERRQAAAEKERIRRQKEEEKAAREAERAERSEERRVGKECRSRWSPYH